MVRLRLVRDKALIKKLLALPKKVAVPAIRKGTRAGAKVILPTARNNAPRLSGKLRKSIKVRAIKRSRQFIGARVTTSASGNLFTGETYYGGFHEYGTAKLTAKEFLQRAVDTKETAAIEATTRTIASEITMRARRK